MKGSIAKAILLIALTLFLTACSNSQPVNQHGEPTARPSSTVTRLPPTPSITPSLSPTSSPTPPPPTATPAPMERIAITVITEDHYFYKETTIAFVNSDGTGIAFPILQDMSIYGSRGYLTWSHNGRYLAFDGGDTVTCPDVLGTECYELNYGTFIADYAQDTILYHIKDTFANVSWSPDSDHLILSKQRDEGRFVNDLYILDVNSGQLKQLTNGPSNDLYPSWSPDRQWISFLRFNPDIPGCSSTPSIDFENEKCNQASLYRIHPDGSDLQLLFEIVFIYRKPSLGEEVSNAPAWSPDSKWLAFLTKNENGLHDQSDISILNL